MSSKLPEISTQTFARGAQKYFISACVWTVTKAEQGSIQFKRGRDDIRSLPNRPELSTRSRCSATVVLLRPNVAEQTAKGRRRKEPKENERIPNETSAGGWNAEKKRPAEEGEEAASND